MLRTTTPAVLALVLGVALAGCGGDASEDDGPATSAGQGAGDAAGAVPLTKQEFLRQGNAICAAGSAELMAIGDGVDQTDQSAMLEAIAGEVVPNVRGQVSALRELGAPTGDEDELVDVLDEADAMMDRWEADPSLALSESGMDPVNERLAAYGLSDCAA